MERTLAMTLPPPHRRQRQPRGRRYAPLSQKSYGNVSAGELADICVSYGLEPQTPDEDPPMSSKRSYVKRRLRTLSREALLAWLAASTRTTQPPRWPSW